MSIDTAFMRRCIRTLEAACEEIETRGKADDAFRDVCRAACVKEFELIMGQAGRLLRGRLAAFFASDRQADRLDFRDLFRHAARHGLMDLETVERWLRYHDDLKGIAYDHGEDFADAALGLLPAFAADARALAVMIEAAGDD